MPLVELWPDTHEPQVQCLKQLTSPSPKVQWKQNFIFKKSLFFFHFPCLDSPFHCDLYFNQQLLPGILCIANMMWVLIQNFFQVSIFSLENYYFQILNFPQFCDLILPPESHLGTQLFLHPRTRESSWDHSHDVHSGLSRCEQELWNLKAEEIKDLDDCHWIHIESYSRQGLPSPDGKT